MVALALLEFTSRLKLQAEAAQDREKLVEGREADLISHEEELDVRERPYPERH